MKLFLQKMQNFRALGAPPPDPRASGGWGLCTQTPSLRQLGAKPPDPHWSPAAGGSAPRPPKQPTPLRISGYAPAPTVFFLKSEHRILFRPEKAFGFRQRPFFFLEITCFWPEKPFKFLISARKSLRILAKSFLFGDHLHFNKNSPKSNSEIMKIWFKFNAGFQLCPPDFSFAPPPRSR